MKHLLNITKINGAEVEPVDVITFGSPCQDLSVAGKRAGIQDGERSNLFFEAVRIIKEMRDATNNEYPKYAVWENVPGAFSSNKGHDFHAVLEALCSVCDDTVSIPRPYDRGRTDRLVWRKAGEIVGDNYSIAWRTLDAQYWGVPQRRKRIYLVADFTGRRAGEILFKQDSLRGNLPQGNETGQEATVDAVGGVDGSIRAVGIDGYNFALTGDKAATVGVNCGISTGRNGVIESVDGSVGVECIAFAADKASTLRAGAGAPKHMADILGRLVVLNDQGGSSINVESEEISPTLRANSHQHEPVIALQANGIDRADTAGCNGCGWRENESYTLNTVDRHAVCFDRATFNQGINAQYDFEVSQEGIVSTVVANGPSGVCYDARGNGDGETVLFEPRSPDGEPRIYDDICPTLNTAQGGQRQPCIVQKAYTMQRSDEYQSCDVASTQSARQYKSATDLVVEETICFDETQITSPANGNNPQWNEPSHPIASTDRPPTVICKKPPRKYIIRRLTPTECARLQGFPDNWGHLAPYNPADADFWEDVRKTHAEINGKKYKPVKDIKKWYNKLHTDSAEYKMWGNGIALPNAEYVLTGIAEHGAKTLGSLFDGSGGFPLAGVLNGIEPLWASEVEPYPIAVTKSRFKENNND